MAGAGVVLALLDRYQRSSSRRSTPLLIMALGFGLLYFGQVIGYLLTTTTTEPINHLVESLPLYPGATLICIGIITICWPPRLRRSEVAYIVSSTVLAAAALAPIWMLLVAPYYVGWGPSWHTRIATVDVWIYYVVMVAVVMLAVSSVRTGALPVQQLILLQLSVFVYVAADITSHSLPIGDAKSYISWSILGFIVSAGLTMIFAAMPAVVPETVKSRKIRDLWSSLIPMLPVIAFGVALFIYVNLGGIPGTLPLSLGLAAILGVAVLSTITRLRVTSLRNAAIQSSVASTLRSGVSSGWFNALVGDARDLVFVVDRNGVIVFATPSVTALLGRTEAALTGTAFLDLTDDYGGARFADVCLRAAANPHDRGPHEIALFDLDGLVHDTETMISPLRYDDYDGFVLTCRDVTDRRQLSAALAASSFRDPLTGLLNRAGFLNRTDKLVNQFDEGLAVALIDLTGFRALNDSHGQSVGDEVLIKVATVLSRLPRSVPVVARIGGDEFAFAVHSASPELDVGAAARELAAALTSVTLTDGEIVELTFSMGYVVTDRMSATTAVALMEQADLALAEARFDSHSNNKVIRYEEHMRVLLIERLGEEELVKTAISESRFEPHYQPIINLNTGRIKGVEALVRMRHHDGELVPPGMFIPVAERLGVIHKISAIMLDKGLADLRELNEVTSDKLFMAFNISVQQLQPNFSSQILRQIRVAGVDPTQVEVEVTESALMDNQELATQILTELRMWGIKVAIDDFGTGFSSLSYLANLPVDTLKVDQSFVSGMMTDPRSEAIVRSVVSLAHSLELHVVAEGVETAEMYQRLLDFECESGQGFLMAKPMPFNELVAFISNSDGVLDNQNWLN